MMHGVWSTGIALLHDIQIEGPHQSECSCMINAPRCIAYLIICGRDIKLRAVGMGSNHMKNILHVRNNSCFLLCILIMMVKVFDKLSHLSVMRLGNSKERQTMLDGCRKPPTCFNIEVDVVKELLPVFVCNRVSLCRERHIQINQMNL